MSADQQGSDKMDTMNILRIYPRDIIAVIVLIACFLLIWQGVDTFITAITAVIIGYYFSKRVYEERADLPTQTPLITKTRHNVSAVPEIILETGERKQDFSHK